MNRLLALLYGVIVYCFFLATFLYAVGFVGGIVVPKTIDSGAPGPLGFTLLVDVVLLGLFAMQHSVMARPAFKRWWTKLVPKPVERSTFVLFASLALALLMWQWRPAPAAVWTAPGAVAAGLLQVLFLVGWGTVLASTFLINHFELFGLTQVWAHFRGRELSRPVFRTPGFYRWVRHPIYLGFLLAFWAAPWMSVGHLVFAIATTGYILIGIALEERDLLAEFGDQYRRYRASVGMLWPRLRGPARSVESAKHAGAEPLVPR